MTPVACSAKPATIPSPTDRSQPVVASSSGLPRTRCRSSSKPARKISAERPRSDNRLIGSEIFTSPSTLGPTMIPRKISKTRLGSISLVLKPAASGARNAITRMTNSVPEAESTAGRYRRDGWRAVVTVAAGGAPAAGRGSGGGDGDVGGLHRGPDRRAGDEPEVGERGRRDLGGERHRPPDANAHA